MRRERNEICRLRHQATTFFECANQTDQDANIRNFIAEPSNSHINSAAEELGLETMGTVKGRIVQRPNNRVANKSFQKTESHAIRDRRDHCRRTSRRSGRTVLAKVGRTDSEERMTVRDPSKVVRPEAGSILCKSKRVIIINDESKSRHRAARERVRRDGGKLEKKKKSRGIGGGTRVRVVQRGREVPDQNCSQLGLDLEASKTHFRRKPRASSSKHKISTNRAFPTRHCAV